MLKATDDPGLLKWRDALFGEPRDDLPRAAGLDAALRELLADKKGSQAFVRLRELFDRLVEFRNELAHPKRGPLSPSQYQRLAGALLAGVSELLSRFDVLAGRRLLFIEEIKLLPSDERQIESYDLTGESPRRLAATVVPASSALKPALDSAPLTPWASPMPPTPAASVSQP